MPVSWAKSLGALALAAGVIRDDDRRDGGGPAEGNEALCVQLGRAQSRQIDYSERLQRQGADSGRFLPDPASQGRRAVRLRQQRQDHHRSRLLGTVRRRRSIRAARRMSPSTRSSPRSTSSRPTSSMSCSDTSTSIMPAISASSSTRRSSIQRDEIKNAFWPAPGFADVLHHRRISPCCATASAAACPASTRPSSSTATSICSATTASKSIAPYRTRRAARSWWCACPRPVRWC